MNFLDRINLCYIWGKTYFSEKNRWAKKADSDRKSNRVFYGFESVSGPEQQVFGGLVKLQDLQQSFPNHPDNPDILYLVSSALPYFPVRMAKMAKRAGAKLVINQNGVAYPGWFGKGWAKYNAPMQQLHEMADFVFYQSRFCKDSADKFLGKRKHDYEILYNPVDTRQFTPNKKSRDGKIPITVLLAGSHWSPYRPLVALDVLQRICSIGDVAVQLRIAGRFCWTKKSADGQDQVFEYAKKLGVERQVKFTGPYTQQQALELFQTSSILLHTKYNDPCPRLVVEAMACGLPVVYSATGGTPELVGEFAGIGVPGPLDWENDHAPDAEDLAQGVMRVAADLEGYSLAARARAVEKFDVQPWLRHHGEIFNEVLL